MNLFFSFKTKPFGYFVEINPFVHIKALTHKWKKTEEDKGRIHDRICQFNKENKSCCFFSKLQFVLVGF